MAVPQNTGRPWLASLPPQGSHHAPSPHRTLALPTLQTVLPRHHPGTGQGLTFYLLRAGLGPEPRDLPRWVTCSHLLLTEAPRTASLAQRGPHDSARGHTPGNVLSSAATAAVGHHGWLCRRRAGAGARVCVGMNLGISGAAGGGWQGRPPPHKDPGFISASKWTGLPMSPLAHWANTGVGLRA